MEEIKIWVKEPGKNPRPVTVEKSLEALQSIVGGFIESWEMASDLAILCNEEGKLDDLPFNCNICGENFVGTIALVGVRGDEFVDCNPSEEFMRKYLPNMWEAKNGRQI